MSFTNSEPDNDFTPNEFEELLNDFHPLHELDNIESPTDVFTTPTGPPSALIETAHVDVDQQSSLPIEPVESVNKPEAINMENQTDLAGHNVYHDDHAHFDLTPANFQLNYNDFEAGIIEGSALSREFTNPHEPSSAWVQTPVESQDSNQQLNASNVPENEFPNFDHLVALNEDGESPTLADFQEGKFPATIMPFLNPTALEFVPYTNMSSSSQDPQASYNSHVSNLAQSSLDLMPDEDDALFAPQLQHDNVSHNPIYTSQAPGISWQQLKQHFPAAAAQLNGNRRPSGVNNHAFGHQQMAPTHAPLGPRLDSLDQTFQQDRDQHPGNHDALYATHSYENSSNQQGQSSNVVHNFGSVQTMPNQTLNQYYGFNNTQSPHTGQAMSNLVPNQYHGNNQTSLDEYQGQYLSTNDFGNLSPYLPIGQFDHTDLGCDQSTTNLDRVVKSQQLGSNTTNNHPYARDFKGDRARDFKGDIAGSLKSQTFTRKDQARPLTPVQAKARHQHKKNHEKQKRKYNKKAEAKTTKHDPMHESPLRAYYNVQGDRSRLDDTVVAAAHTGMFSPPNRKLNERADYSHHNRPSQDNLSHQPQNNGFRLQDVTSQEPVHSMNVTPLLDYSSPVAQNQNIDDDQSSPDRFHINRDDLPAYSAPQCSCGEPDDLSMIGCSVYMHRDQEHQQFHLSCVGLSRLPEHSGAWSCPACRKPPIEVQQRQRARAHPRTSRINASNRVAEGILDENSVPAMSPALIRPQSTQSVARTKRAFTPDEDNYSDSSSPDNDSPQPQPKKRRIAALSQPSKRNAGQGKHTGWSEVEQLYCMRAMKEVKNSGECQRIDQLWDAIAIKMQARGYERTAGGVKNIWNRFLRERSGFDERANPRPEMMQTGLLKKKDDPEYKPRPRKGEQAQKRPYNKKKVVQSARQVSTAEDPDETQDAGEYDGTMTRGKNDYDVYYP